jgi:hypothetical protein
MTTLHQCEAPANLRGPMPFFGSVPIMISSELGICHNADPVLGQHPEQIDRGRQRNTTNEAARRQVVARLRREFDAPAQTRRRRT